MTRFVRPSYQQELSRRWADPSCMARDQVSSKSRTYLQCKLPQDLFWDEPNGRQQRPHVFWKELLSNEFRAILWRSTSERRCTWLSILNVFRLQTCVSSVRDRIKSVSATREARDTPLILVTRFLILPPFPTGGK